MSDHGITIAEIGTTELLTLAHETLVELARRGIAQLEPDAQQTVNATLAQGGELRATWSAELATVALFVTHGENHTCFGAITLNREAPMPGTRLN